jgi:hypothetical protein
MPCWSNTSNNTDCGNFPTFTWFSCGCSPIKINSTDVIYTGENLINTGINTGDNLTLILAKIDTVIGSGGGGFTLTNGNGTTANSTAVDWGGIISSDVNISGYHNITLGNSPTLQSFSAHVTDGANTLIDLTLSGLGYLEIRNTNIGVYDESITLNTAGLFLLYKNSVSSKQTLLNIGDNFVNISSTNSSFPGAQYDIDYSLNFTLLSLISKGYADIHLLGLTFTNSPSNGNVPTFNGTNWTFSTPGGGGGNGTYSPSVTNTTNVASITISDVSWSQVGSIVTVAGLAIVTATSGTSGSPATTIFEVSLPVSSTLASSVCRGSMSILSATWSGGYISPSSGRARFSYQAISTSATDVSFVFQYKVE